MHRSLLSITFAAVFIAACSSGGDRSPSASTTSAAPTEAFDSTADISETAVERLCNGAELLAGLSRVFGEAVTLRYPEHDTARRHARCAFEGERSIDSPSAGPGAPLQIFVDFGQRTAEEAEITTDFLRQRVEAGEAEVVDGLPGAAFYVREHELVVGIAMQLPDGRSVNVACMKDGEVLSLELHRAAADAWVAALGLSRT